MEPKIKITPQMIKVSRLLLRKLEQLGRLIEEQDKEHGLVRAIRLSEDMKDLKVAIFDRDLGGPHHAFMVQEIDINGNVTLTVVGDEIEEPEKKEPEKIDLFGGSGINWFEED